MRLQPREQPGEERRDDRSIRTARRKGLLVCPECGHESHVDGDWHVEEPDGRRNYRCPDCGTLVVSQPTFPGHAP